jgi:hypothetical protein
MGFGIECSQSGQTLSTVVLTASHVAPEGCKVLERVLPKLSVMSSRTMVERYTMDATCRKKGNMSLRSKQERKKKALGLPRSWRLGFTALALLLAPWRRLRHRPGIEPRNPQSPKASAA